MEISSSYPANYSLIGSQIQLCYWLAVFDPPIKRWLEMTFQRSHWPGGCLQASHWSIQTRSEKRQLRAVNLITRIRVHLSVLLTEKTTAIKENKKLKKTTKKNDKIRDSLKPLEHHNIMVSSGLRGPSIGFPLCRETSVSQTANVKYLQARSARN